MIKAQSGEWKEKLTGIKSEEKAAGEAKFKNEKAPAKKVKETKRHPFADVQPSPMPGDAQ